MLQQLRQSRDQPFVILLSLQRAFPDGHHVPTDREQGFFVPQVAALVAGDLCGPPLRPRSGQAEGRTMFMPMPEAAVHEDDAAVFRQDDVLTAPTRFDQKSTIGVHQSSIKPLGRSGFVFRPRMQDMTSERFCGVKMSMGGRLKT